MSAAGSAIRIAAGKRPKSFRVNIVQQLAARQLQRRIGTDVKIKGIGFGKKLYEKAKRLRAGPRTVHLLVAKKKKVKDWKKIMTVKVPGVRKRQTVHFDVITLGRPVQQVLPKRVLTVADNVKVGRLFGFEPPPVAGPSGAFEMGTPGALAESSIGNVHLVTAGHVFVNTCSQPWERPSGNLLLRIKDRSSSRGTTNFNPTTLGTPPFLTDGIAMEVPNSMVPAETDAGWPPRFGGEFATVADIEAAEAIADDGAFLWVERDGGVSVKIQANLIGKTEQLEMNDLCSNQAITYPFVYYYQFPDLTGDPNDEGNRFVVTIGGDSGAGLFIPDATDPQTPKLLGIHFLLTHGDKNEVVGLAADAQNVFQRAFGKASIYGRFSS